jgi:hypothetical protein
MIEYSVGPDDLSIGDRFKDADWVVYWYQDGGYDGRGTLVWKQGDKYETTNLGHCSCYGPLDSLDACACCTLTQVLEEIRPISKTDYNYDAGEALYQKVMRLTREHRMGRE